MTDKKKNKKEKGFLVLIAVMVSMILLSIGIFIATISVREIALSNSVKDSQRAFFAADTVTECALYKEFKNNAFSSAKLTSHEKNNALWCNNKYFDWYDSYPEDYNNNGVDYIKHIYYISLAPALTDADGNNLLKKSEIETNSASQAKQYPYIKLIVWKPETDLSKPTIVKAYGHNVLKGPTIVERAIETKW